MLGTMNATASAARAQAATPAGCRGDRRLSSSATISAAGSTKNTANRTAIA